MNEIRLNTPLSHEDVTRLKVGDRVLVSGRIVTARDRAHRWLVEEATPAQLPFDLAGGIIYHCGPVVRSTDAGGFEVVAAGPTTSARMNPYTPALIGKFAVRAIIGKGGMDDAVLDAMTRFGAVFLSAVGGAAVTLAGRVVGVEGSFKTDEFGSPEGMWVLRVEDFPAIVTMDAHGRSLHREVEAASRARLERLLERESR